MAGNTLIADCEVYKNFFYLGFKRTIDGKRVGFELSDRSTFDLGRVRHIMSKNKIVTFNGNNFDLPIIYLALNGAPTQQLKAACDHLIKNRVPSWQAEADLEIRIPKIDHIDIMETNPAVGKSLKSLNGSMHHNHLEELPFNEAHEPTHAEMDRLIEYCNFGDLDGTERLYNYLAEPIMLRERLAERYRTVDLRSKSDAQVGETILKTEVERRSGARIRRPSVPDHSEFFYKAPEWASFKTPYMQEVLRTIQETPITVKKGTVQFPKEFSKFHIEFDGLVHTLGIGGLHSTERNRMVKSDEQTQYIDADVAGQYPRIIMKLGLYPKALGPKFLPVYESIIDTRIAAKKAKDKVTDKGLKIAVNGSYGKLGSAYSALFAPHLMVAVTLTGQISLLMLIEAAHLAGIPVASSNTDGVLFACPRAMFNGFVQKDGVDTDRLNPCALQDIIDWWEDLTSFDLEFGPYERVYSQSVNTYIAIRADGSYKRKGSLANHWRPELPWGGKNTDYDMLREGLKKSPAMTIVNDAVLGKLLHEIPVEDTINQCHDIREFVTVAASNSGATWGPGEPHYVETERTTPKGKLVKGRALVGYGGEYRIGKTARFYWSKNGNPMLRVDPNPATGTRPIIPNSSSCRPAMFFDEAFTVPDDVDRERYIEAAYATLKSIGYDGPLTRARPTASSPWELLFAAKAAV